MKEAMVALLPQQGVESALGWTPEILQSRCHFGFAPITATSSPEGFLEIDPSVPRPRLVRHAADLEEAEHGKEIGGLDYLFGYLLDDRRGHA
jgi:hypothetical protein